MVRSLICVCVAIRICVRSRNRRLRIPKLFTITESNTKQSVEQPTYINFDCCCCCFVGSRWSLVHQLGPPSYRSELCAGQLSARVRQRHSSSIEFFGSTQGHTHKYTHKKHWLRLSMSRVLYDFFMLTFPSRRLALLSQAFAASTL